MRKHLLVVASIIAIGALTDTGPLMLGSDSAEAVIGRPLTPVSYAGVARRTTRRAVYAGAATGGYYGGAAYAAPVVQTTAVVSTLPAGCGSISTAGGVYYQCGGARYEPYYSGGTVVYRHY
jgi:hypothetical protein